MAMILRQSARVSLVLGSALALALATHGALAQSSADSLSVKIDGLRNDKGQVGCMIFASKDGFPTEPTKAAGKQFVKIADRAATCVFPDMKPGIYAAVAMHDENGNGKMDTNFLGIPSEGNGASRDARGTLGPPKFEDARFSYAGGAAGIAITIHY